MSCRILKLPIGPVCSESLTFCVVIIKKCCIKLVATALPCNLCSGMVCYSESWQLEHSHKRLVPANKCHSVHSKGETRCANQSKNHFSYNYQDFVAALLVNSRSIREI